MTARVICWRVLIVALYVFLLAPLAVVLIVSFDTRPYLSFPPASFSFHSYDAMFHNVAFRRAGLTSLLLGAAVSALSLGLGTAAAYALDRGSFRGKSALQWLFLSPMLVPHIVLAVGLMMTLQPIGLLDSFSGLLLSHIGITLPYTTRIVSSGLTGLDRSCEEAARIHGASPWQTFIRVIMPGLWRSLVAAALIAFLFSFDEAVIALFIAGNKATTLPLAIFQYIQFRTDPQVAALSVVVVILTMIPVVLIERSISLRRAIG